MTINRTYTAQDLIPYIDWPHFLFAWEFKGANLHSKEAETLKAEALKVLSEMSAEEAIIKCRAQILDAGSEGDDILIFDTNKTLRFPCLRQQVKDKGSAYYRCLSDYLAPVGMQHPIGNRLGVFATAAHVPALQMAMTDFQKMMLQTLADRLAEAAADRLHHEVLHAEWGKPLDQPLYGIRPAVGYPSLPDMSANFLLGSIIDFSALNIRLTESGMMIPHAAVSGLIFAHPKAVYFNVGPISEEQFLDYAKRREVSAEWLHKFVHYFK